MKAVNPGQSVIILLVEDNRSDQRLTRRALMAPNPEPRPFVPEIFGPLDSPPDDRVQRSRGIQSELSGHNQPSFHFPSSAKPIQKQPPPYLTKRGP